MDIDASSIICETRLYKRAFTISVAEMVFIGRSADVSDGEKLIWLILATYCANDKHLVCSLSYQQLSNAVNKKWDVVHRALLRLKSMGFIENSSLPILHGEEITPEISNIIHIFKLTLPAKGLLALKQTPKCKPDGLVLHENGVYRRPPILINLLKTNRELLCAKK